MPGRGEERTARQQRMVVALYHNEGVARCVLGRDVPGPLGVTGPSADVETGALAEGIEREAFVPAERLAGRGLDRSRGLVEEACQEFAEGALADKADNRAVG